MNFDWRNNRDFFAGLLYIVIGALGMFIARDYPFGSALRMGPGYFPSVLGGMMIAFGIAVMMMGVKNNEKMKGSWSFRATVTDDQIVLEPMGPRLIATAIADPDAIAV